MFSVKRILVPVDYSNVSHAAVNAALQCAHLHGSHVYLLHVHPTLEANIKHAINDDHPGELTDMLLAEEGRLRELVDLEYSRAADAGRPLDRVSMTPIVAGGNVVENMLQLVEEYEIDLIVTGTHGPKGLAEQLIGSVSQRVVRSCPCSVFVVKPSGYPYLRD